MTEEHPITPSPELVQQLWSQCTAESENLLNKFATLMARWGWDKRGAANEKELQEARDQELEACCEWLDEIAYRQSLHLRGSHLRAARRPKPPSLKEQALEDFDGLMSELDGAGNYSNCAERIRRALEQLPD